jgi:predicted amidophosphoribosyltransferase
MSVPVRTFGGMELFRGGCVLCGAGREPLCPGCGRHLSPPPTGTVRGIGPVPALFAYEGGGARVVQALKFRDGRRLVAPLADGLTGLAELGPDALVSWIPTSGSRRRRRGFDQAELLARALARRLDRPCRPVLRRLPGPSQTGRSRAERAANVAFRAMPTRPVRNLVVIDDVCTTGATIRAARDALTAAACTDVRFVVVARTP